MRRLVRLALSFALLSSLIACGGGGGGSSTNTPTDTSLVFSLYPATYFDGNYSSLYAQRGDTETVSWSVQSGSANTFNGQPVKTIDHNLSFTNIATSAVLSGTLNQYFSTDINNLMLMGYYQNVTNVSATATSVNIIPLTGSIGNFGTIGSYTLSDGSSETIAWALLDGFNGKAKLEITNIERDSSGILDTTEVNAWIISQDGTRISVTTTVTYHQSGNQTFTWVAQ